MFTEDLEIMVKGIKSKPYFKEKGFELYLDQRNIPGEIN